MKAPLRFYHKFAGATIGLLPCKKQAARKRRSLVSSAFFASSAVKGFSNSANLYLFWYDRLVLGLAVVNVTTTATSQSAYGCAFLAAEQSTYDCSTHR